MIKSPSKFNMFSLQDNFKKPNTIVYNFSPTTILLILNINIKY